MNNYLDVLTHKYATFTGRATRTEYWMYTLVNLIIIAVLELIMFVTKATTVMSAIILLYGLAVVIPGIAVGIRRLHDTGRPGWWILISLTAIIPIIGLIGPIILLVLYCLDSQPGDNMYGPNPKGIAAGQTPQNH